MFTPNNNKNIATTTKSTLIPSNIATNSIEKGGTQPHS
jgi:hypothetical protein